MSVKELDADDVDVDGDVDADVAAEDDVKGAAAHAAAKAKADKDAASSSGGVSSWIGAVTNKLFEWETSVYHSGSALNGHVASALNKVYIDKILYYGWFPAVVAVGCLMGKPHPPSWQNVLLPMDFSGEGGPAGI